MLKQKKEFWPPAGRRREDKDVKEQKDEKGVKERRWLEKLKIFEQLN